MLKTDRIHGILDIFLLIPILAILCTIFVVDDKLAYGVISGKYVWFYFSMILLSVSIISAAIIKCMEKVDFRLPDLLIFLFCCVAVLVTVNHTGRLTNKCLLLGLLMAFYFYLRMFFSGKNKLMNSLCCIAFVVTGLVEAVWGLMQLYGFSHSQHILFKITGSLFNPGPYSGWLAMVFPMALGYVIFNHKERKVTQSSLACVFRFLTTKETNLHKVFRLFTEKLHNFRPMTVLCCLTISCIILVLPAARSRASWLSLLGGSAFILIMYGIQNMKVTAYFKKYRKRVILFSFTAIVLLVVSMSGLFLLKKDSAWGRAFTWKISLQTIKKHPLGVGLGNFGGSYGDVQSAYFASGAGTEREEYVAEGVEYAFNEYLQICIETGIIPFLFFLSFVFYVLYFGIKNKNYLPAGSLISLLIFASMSYPFNILPFLVAFIFLSVLCIADISVNIGNEISSTAVHCPKFAVCFFLFAPVAIVLSMSFFRSPLSLQTAYKQWKQIITLHNANMHMKVIKEYVKPYPYLQDEILYLFGYAQCLSDLKQYEKSNKVLLRTRKISCNPVYYTVMGRNHQALKEYELAEQSFRKAKNLVPNRLYPHYLLAKLYYEMGLKDKMESEINIVLTKPPKVESKAVEEMRKELIKLMINK
jgi:tetratricopeptide (TPR) repeat protein